MCDAACCTGGARAPWTGCASLLAVRGSLYARRMRELERMVRELLAAAQQDRKAKLDAGLVDALFKAGDQVLRLTKELLRSASCCRCGTPFTFTACPRPNPYTLAQKMLCSSTVNVNRLKPFHARADDPQAPGSVSLRGRRASTRWSCCSTTRR